MKKYLLSPTLLIAVLSTAIFSCSQSTNNNKAVQSSFFDLSDFFDEELKHLAGVKKVKKTVSINGKVEEQILDSIDLKKEFTIFTNSDINKLTWLDKYKVDSSFVDNQLSRIVYTAKDEALKTQALTIDYKNNQVHKIYIENNALSAVTSSQQFLEYIAGKSYSIKSTQKLVASSENTLSIRVELQ